jgi:serine/threonine protein kinase
VYKVREKDGKVYAVKKSKRQFRSKKDRALFMGEVKMMKKMIEEPCDHIVKLIRAWQEDGYFFVQLDLAERGTLKELFMNLVKKREYLKESTIWHIVHDVASGLQHIHQCGVVHLGNFF